MCETNEKLKIEKADGVRSEVGIVAYLQKMNDGTTKLVLDDVRSASVDNQKVWKRKSPYTSNQYKNEKLESLDLSEKEFSEIGENLIIRLSALTKELLNEHK